MAAMSRQEMLEIALRDLARIESRELDASLDELADLVDSINEGNGWNERELSPGDWAALAHSEISEFFEEHRNGREAREIYYTHDGQKPEGQAIEQADVLIRTLHWFARHCMSPREAVLLKLRYNANRGYRHGGKVV
jgi:hypothetical protein